MFSFNRVTQKSLTATDSDNNNFNSSLVFTLVIFSRMLCHENYPREPCAKLTYVKYFSIFFFFFVKLYL